LRLLLVNCHTTKRPINKSNTRNHITMHVACALSGDHPCVPRSTLRNWPSSLSSNAPYQAPSSDTRSLPPSSTCSRPRRFQLSPCGTRSPTPPSDRFRECALRPAEADSFPRQVSAVPIGSHRTETANRLSTGAGRLDSPEGYRAHRTRAATRGHCLSYDKRRGRSR
jgi:hypothetical protein